MGRYIKIYRREMLDSSGSGQEAMVSCFENGNEPSASTLDLKFLD
jgi:hypothetical protein